MPLRWVRGENPYRLNPFGILQLGPQQRRPAIAATRGQLVTRIRRGRTYVVGGRELTEADVQAAEAVLIRDETWAEEVILVHPMPSTDGAGIHEAGQAVLAATAVPMSSSPLRLTRPSALAPLVPPSGAPDVPWPEWDELGVPGPRSAADLAADVQFDA